MWMPSQRANTGCEAHRALTSTQRATCHPRFFRFAGGSPRRRATQQPKSNDCSRRKSGLRCLNALVAPLAKRTASGASQCSEAGSTLQLQAVSEAPTSIVGRPKSLRAENRAFEAKFLRYFKGRKPIGNVGVRSLSWQPAIPAFGQAS